MNSLGRITEIWRYPVSSVGGESMHSADLEIEGIVGDRLYALIDRETRLPAAPEKDVRWRKALHLQARSMAGELPLICFPDGASFDVMDRVMSECLSDYFGFATVVAAYEPDDLHAGMSLTQQRHEHFPMHVMTTKSLQHLAVLRQVDTVDVRRFRPSVLMTVDEGSGFVESGWIGRMLQIGPVALRAEEETKRCGMTFIAQPGLDEDPDILRNILRHNKRHLGIYCSVAGIGTLQVGDDVAMP